MLSLQIYCSTRLVGSRNEDVGTFKAENSQPFLDIAGENKVVWDEIANILEGAFRDVAPKKRIADLDDRRPAADRKSQSLSR